MGKQNPQRTGGGRCVRQHNVLFENPDKFGQQLVAIDRIWPRFDALLFLQLLQVGEFGVHRLCLPESLNRAIKITHATQSEPLVEADGAIVLGGDFEIHAREAHLLETSEGG